MKYTPKLHIWNIKNSVFTYEICTHVFIHDIKFYFHPWNMHWWFIHEIQKILFSNVKYAPMFSHINMENSIFIHDTYTHVFIHKILKIPFSSMKYSPIFLYMKSHAYFGIRNTENSIFIHEICTHFSYMKYRKFNFHSLNFHLCVHTGYIVV